MPEMDGVTFLREALQRYPDMAVIMLTGVAEVSTAVECLKLGALDYISKPVMIEEVRARVDKALEKRQLVLQNRFYQQNLEARVRELDRRNKAIADQRRPDAGSRPGGQGRLHQRPLQPGEPLRGQDRRAARLHRRAAGADPAGRRAARHRQDRHPRGRAQQARAADARGVRARQGAHDPGRADPGAVPGRVAHRAPDRALPPRADGRQRVSRRDSPASRFRSRRASWRWWTPSTP